MSTVRSRAFIFESDAEEVGTGNGLNADNEFTVVVETAEIFNQNVQILKIVSSTWFLGNEPAKLEEVAALNILGAEERGVWILQVESFHRERLKVN